MPNRSAQQLGRLGGRANTPAQNAARAANGKLGGRPRKKRTAKRHNIAVSGGSTAAGETYTGRAGSVKEDHESK